jgi:molecular chaperone GrpE (heat shock protein)
VREKAFDQLYEELKQYKEDFLFQAEKPLLLDLMLFYDSLNWFQESLIKQEMSPDVIADSFQYLIDEFLEVLYRRDVMPIDEEQVFNRQVHKAVKVVETDDESDDYRIAQVLKRGFGRNGKQIRAEEVVILRHRGSKKG